MEGRELDIIPEGLDDLVRDQDGARKRFPPVHHAVADGMDLPLVGDDAVVLAQEDRQDVFDGLGVIDDFPRDPDLVPVVSVLRAPASIIWYLTDELPQFNTRMFIAVCRPGCI
jgi:hypothetical protein